MINKKCNFNLYFRKIKKGIVLLCIKYKKLHYSLFIGTVASITILFFLFTIQSFNGRLLELDNKWLFISCIPLIISLIIGGYIKNIKGFGIEVEAFNKPISVMKYDIDFSIHGYIEKQFTKDTVLMLDELSKEKQDSITFLIFIKSSKNDIEYSEYIIKKYMIKLTNLRYFVVNDSFNKLYSIINIDCFINYNTNIDEYKSKIINKNIIRLFIKFLNGDIKEFKEQVNINRYSINTNISLLSAFQTISNRNINEIAIVDYSNNFQGILTKKNIESQIAMKVIKNL